MNGSRIKILLVDDDLAEAQFVRAVLRQADGERCELSHVGCIADAISLLARSDYDAVLLDLSLPDSAGIDTIVHLQDEAPHVPILVLSSLEDDQTAMYAVRVGAQDYLIKGQLEGRSLLRSIRYAIERKRTQHLQARYHDQAALNSLAIAVSQSLQLDELLEIAIEKVLQVTDCETAYIQLRNLTTGRVSLSAHRGLTPEQIDNLLGHEGQSQTRDEALKSGEISFGTDSTVVTNGTQAGAPKDRLIARIPLKAKAQVVGVLNIETRRRTHFAKRQLELIKAIGNVVGIGLENARLFTETRRQLDRIEVLRDITVAAASSLDLSRVLQTLLDKIVAVLPYSAIEIRLYDRASGELRPTASWNVGHDDEQPPAAKIDRGTGLASIVFESKIPLAIRRFLDDPRTQRPEKYSRLGLISFLGLPMIAHGDGVGVLLIYTKFEHEFAEEEIRFLAALANQAAMTITNYQLYERIRDQAAELERSNRVKDEFLNVMSHEFRTPLNIIMGYCDLMQRHGLGPINQEQDRALSKVTERAKSLLSMLSAILEVTRLETEAMPLLWETFDLNEFLDDIRTAYDVKLEKDLTFDWRPAGATVMLTTDRQKLRIIVDQLLANAIQFSDRGKITVIVAGTADGENVFLSVGDTGVGIPAESYGEIFEKFTQLDSTSTRTHEGIGLGLYMVRKFVDLLNGKVTVKSEVGVGSVFELTLPANGAAGPTMTER